MPLNVIDSCSVWNILSSNRLFTSSSQAKIYFAMTMYVEYECLFKVRKHNTVKDIALKQVLKQHAANGIINSFKLSISDLQEISDLKQRKNLGMGELSSIVFAKKTNQAFLTDDRAARKLASEILGREKVQTTPHLLGYLLHERHLADGDYYIIKEEHKQSCSLEWSNLETFFEEVYNESHRIRLMGSKA